MPKIFHVQLKYPVPATGRDHINVKCDALIVDEEDFMFRDGGEVPKLFVSRENVLFVEYIGDADAEVKEDVNREAGQPSGS